MTQSTRDWKLIGQEFVVCLGLLYGAYYWLSASDTPKSETAVSTTQTAKDDGICPPCYDPAEMKLHEEISKIAGAALIVTHRNTRNSTAPRIVVDLQGAGLGCTWVKGVAQQLVSIADIISQSDAALSLPHLQYNIFKADADGSIDYDSAPSNRIVRISDLAESFKAGRRDDPLLAHGRVISGQRPSSRKKTACGRPGSRRPI